MIKFAKLILISIAIILLNIYIFVSPSQASENSNEAIFAGGCFWCLEHDFEKINGVVSVESGYTGGELKSPNYNNHIGHQESISVIYEPQKITYEELLRNYWRNIDPLDGDGQFCDRGDSYRAIIFAKNKEQKDQALHSSRKAADELMRSSDEIVVKVRDAKQFWIAEDYHQNFAENNSVKYNFYRYSCGRDKRLDQVWGKEARTGKPWREQT